MSKIDMTESWTYAHKSRAYSAPWAPIAKLAVGEDFIGLNGDPCCAGSGAEGAKGDHLTNTKPTHDVMSPPTRYRRTEVPFTFSFLRTFGCCDWWSAAELGANDPLNELTPKTQICPPPSRERRYEVLLFVQTKIKSIHTSVDKYQSNKP